MDSLEQIVSTSSLVRKHWLPLELAISRIVQFEHDFGSAHLALACHAALPSIITPELVNLIRLNFLETAVEWVAESDLLLSPLCNSIGEVTFEIEPQIREVLLVELKGNPIYGSERLEALATLLRDYTEAQSAKTLPTALKRTYRWIADAYLAPDAVVSDMFDTMNSIKPIERLATLATQIQIVKTLELLSEPLEQTSLQVELEDLVNSTRILAYYWYNDRKALARTLQRDKSNIDNVDDVSNVLSNAIVSWVITAERGDGSTEVSTAPKQAKEGLLSSIDLRPKSPPVYHGGALGSVVANAIAAALEFCLMQQHQFPVFTPSRLFMYYNERAIEGTISSDSGSRIPDGVKSVEMQGVCPEEMWPYDITKFAEQPPEACYQAALQYRIFAFKRIRRNLVQMKKCLASGYPFIFGFPVYENFISQQVTETGHVPMPQPGEREIGGHAALAVGYDDANQWFIVRNSFGSGWGMQGYFTLPYAYFTNPKLSRDFWTVRINEAKGDLQKQRPKSGITCLVTLHGIGFEQPPQPQFNIPGYADRLHEHLSKYLDATMLSDDPNREREQRGQNGVIYVQSRWITATGTSSREEGLKRLGTWSQDMRHIEINQAPLVVNDATVSHIALVYSELRSIPPRDSPNSNFTQVEKQIHTVLVSAIDLDSKDIEQPGRQEQASPPVIDMQTMLTYLGDDIASYVTNNTEREQARSFVSEALLRLASRDDISEIVLNTHSNGTVIAFDVLRQLPSFAAAKIKVFITVGSPLRIYVNRFDWVRDVGSIQKIPRWVNFWDPRDPVGSPLVPPVRQYPGLDATVTSDEPGLFFATDSITGKKSRVGIQDVQVDNVKNSTGGGLQAHNYLDNDPEFVQPLAAVLKDLMQEKPDKAEE